jgi:hypothetical protein
MLGAATRLAQHPPGGYCHMGTEDWDFKSSHSESWKRKLLERQSTEFIESLKAAFHRDCVLLFRTRWQLSTPVFQTFS